MEKCKNCQSLSQRLSQAEAELEILRKDNVGGPWKIIDGIKADRDKAVGYLRKIKFLEARLSQAEKMIRIQTDANNHVADKLSQAEAERDGYRGQLEQHEKCTDAFTEEMKIRHEAEIKVNYDKHKQIQSLEARLSHLMDVAGKMAGALEKIAKKEVEFPEYDWSDWNGGDAHCETQMIIALEAKLALAEWDGIKEGGK